MTGIIGATIEEAEALKSIMKNVEENKYADITFFRGNINGREVVFVQSGIGKVNAAITATLLIEKYNVDEVIFSGVAGSVDENVGIGDIVIGTDVVQHDFDATEFGYKKGQIPQMPIWSFETDRNLIERVKNIDGINARIIYGRILTGDQFIHEKEAKVKLGVDFKALCVDMESGAVAQVCYRLNKRFLIIRSISDSITDNSAMEYDKFVKLAAENAKEIVKKIII